GAAQLAGARRPSCVHGLCDTFELRAGGHRLVHRVAILGHVGEPQRDALAGRGHRDTENTAVGSRIFELDLPSTAVLEHIATRLEKHDTLAAIGQKLAYAAALDVRSLAVEDAGCL